MQEHIESTAARLQSPDVEIRVVGPQHAAQALLILREASQWLAGRGLRPWSEYDLQRTDLPGQSAAGCLILGFSSTGPAACMLLQRSDPHYWPRAREGSALYLHKLAVRRAYAGCGWGTRMIAWAKTETQARGIRRLRLDTLPDSPPAELYVAHGFRFVSRTKHPDGDTDMWRMECLLSRRVT